MPESDISSDNPAVLAACMVLCFLVTVGGIGAKVKILYRRRALGR